MALYEMFEHVGHGNGDHGSSWKRIGWTSRSREAALDMAIKNRVAKPNSTFRMFYGRRNDGNGIGKLLWDFPPLNA